MSRVLDTIKEEASKYGWGLILLYPEKLESLVKRLVDERGKIRVLDIGAWKCMLRKWLLERYGDKVHYTGIDVIDPPGRDPQAEFYTMSPEYLLFEPNTFDLVVLLETLEHVIDYPRALREIHRVLRPGGYLFIQSVICTDHNAWLDRTHYHVLHPETLSRLLEFLGLKVVESGGNGNFYLVAFKA